MKAVMLSIQPRWVELIASAKKTVEVRKTNPKIDVPFKCYIYETKGKLRWCNKCQETDCERPYPNCACWEGQGKVIGEFVCDRIDDIRKRGVRYNFDYCYQSLNVFGNDDIEVEITDIKKSCIAIDDLNSYGSSSVCLYAWHITDLVIYDKPKELSEFYQEGKNTEKFYYDYCAGCPHHETPVGDDPCNGCDGNRNYFYRPPQSWCYCEELK